MAKLIDILNDLLHERGKKAPELGGGLMLQFKKAQNEAYENKILCYRKEIAPSPVEVDTVMKTLIKLLPMGTAVRKERKTVEYVGSDCVERIGKVICWKTAVPQQSTLLDTPAPPAGAYEGGE